MSKKKFYQTKEFIKLQNEWYEKLKTSNFKDLEWLDKSQGRGQNSPYLAGKSIQTVANSYSPEVEQYYSMARSYLHARKFKSALIRDTWKLHSEGMPYRKMSTILTKKYGKRYKRRTFSPYWICRVIQEVRADMFNYHVHHPEGDYAQLPELDFDELDLSYLADCSDPGVGKKGSGE